MLSKPYFSKRCVRAHCWEYVRPYLMKALKMICCDHVERALYVSIYYLPSKLFQQTHDSGISLWPPGVEVGASQWLGSQMISTFSLWLISHVTLDGSLYVCGDWKSYCLVWRVQVRAPAWGLKDKEYDGVESSPLDPRMALNLFLGGQTWIEHRSSETGNLPLSIKRGLFLPPYEVWISRFDKFSKPKS